MLDAELGRGRSGHARRLREKLKQLITNGRGCQDTVELDAEEVRMDETFDRL